MKWFIRVFDHALPFPFCEELILYFEHNSAHHVKTELEGIRKFTELSLGEKEARFQTTLIEAQERVLKQYREDCGIQATQFPPVYGFETFRIKRYLPNSGEEFGPHTDVGDHASARRFIAFLWYLNDVQEGGETLFPVCGKVIPKQASVLVFPPLWTYLHQGLPVISGPKYIISSYCHYL
jgi:hypothetical protein